MREQITETKSWKLESSVCPRKFNPEPLLEETEILPELQHRMPKGLSTGCLSSQNLATELILRRQRNMNSPGNMINPTVEVPSKTARITYGQAFILNGPSTCTELPDSFLVPYY